MAALRGFFQADDGNIQSRLAHKYLQFDGETWDGAIKVMVRANGNFEVFIGEKGDARQSIVSGNINDGDRHYRSSARSEERIGD